MYACIHGKLSIQSCFFTWGQIIFCKPSTGVPLYELWNFISSLNVLLLLSIRNSLACNPSVFIPKHELISQSGQSSLLLSSLFSNILINLIIFM